MNKRILIIGLLFCLLMVGCALENATAEDPFGAVTLDPCDVQTWVTAAHAAGAATSAIGVATGSPQATGVGWLIAGIASIVGTVLLAKR